MSLKPTSIPPVPEATAHVARAAFPKGNLYLRLRDELGALYLDSDFAQLYPAVGPLGQHVITAAAINVARLDAWWAGRPHAPTRTSRFARLAA